MMFVPHVIDGVECESRDGAVFESIDPATRQAHATIALGSAADAERAVDAARRAFEDGPWPRMGSAARGAVLHRLADLVVEHTEELALADTTDMGKPIDDARRADRPSARSRAPSPTPR